MKRQAHHIQAFARTEIVAVLIILTVAAMILSVAAGAAHRGACLAGSTSNLQQFGLGITAFAADNEDRIVSFTWRAGEFHQDPDHYTYPPSPTDNDAAAHQAVSILRRLANRQDIQVISAWIPHILYSPLPLVEYLQQPLPTEFMVSPSDANRLAWQRASRTVPADDRGQAYFALPNRPVGSGNADKRWPYSSSYQFVPASYSPDALTNTNSGPVPTVAQDPMGHRYYQVGNERTVLGHRHQSEIRHPTSKVLVFEREAGDLAARRYYYAYTQARSAMLFGDGSVSVRSSAQANRGFFPNTPVSATPTRTWYQPELTWEAPTISGEPEIVDGRVQWCRSGLLGRDFAGPEVPWVP